MIAHSLQRVTDEDGQVQVTGRLHLLLHGDNNFVAVHRPHPNLKLLMHTQVPRLRAMSGMFLIIGYYLVVQAWRAIKDNVLQI